jgi:hypothetical protein
MPRGNLLRFTMAAAAIAMIALSGASARAQASNQPRDDLPNPYRTVRNWAQLPDGRKWGSTSGVAIGPDGNIWTYDRCGGNSCVGSNLAPILEFEPSGKFLKNFGSGIFILPHGIFVDKDGNVWVTDGVGGGATPDEVGKHGKGHQIFKFSPDGKVLLTLGKAGVPGNGPDTFNRPSAVAVATNGDIFVADGHHSPLNSPVNARIVKFSRDGKFIKAWEIRIGPRRVRCSACPGLRFQRTAIRRRSLQQSHSDLRSGRQIPRRVEAVRPAQRNFHRQGRHHVRG